MRNTHFAKSLLLLNFVFTIHYTIGSYIHSSFLKEYFSVPEIGILFTASAVLAIFLLSQGEKILVRFGALSPMLLILAINTFTLFALSLSWFPEIYAWRIIPGIFFVIHHTCAVFILRFLFDVFYEEQTDNTKTGTIRGELLTAQNFAWVASPFIFSTLIDPAGKFWMVYTLSAFLSFVLIFLAWNILPHGKTLYFKKIYFIHTLKDVWQKKDIFRIISVNILLHIFFAWMIIYMPVYLRETIGFSWEEIGILFTIMLVPYVLVDIPLGILADRRLGEKEFLFVGFLVLILFTFPMGLVSEKTFYLWAFLLFMSRVGAGAIEIMIETFFFKHVEAGDGNVISLFRNAQPLAYIFAPLVGSAFVLMGVSEGFLFMILPAFMILGVLLASQLKDTK